MRTEKQRQANMLKLAGRAWNSAHSPSHCRQRCGRSGFGVGKRAVNFSATNDARSMADAQAARAVGPRRRIGDGFPFQGVSVTFVHLKDRGLVILLRCLRLLLCVEPSRVLKPSDKNEQKSEKTQAALLCSPVESQTSNGQIFQTVLIPLLLRSFFA